MNILPDCSNYSPFCHPHHPTPFSGSIVGQTLYQVALLVTKLHYYTALLQNLFGNSCLWRSTAVPWGSWTTSRGKWWCSSSSSSNCDLNSLMSLTTLYSLCSLSQSSLFSLSSFLLASPHPFFLFWSILCHRDFKFHSVGLLSEAPLVHGFTTLPSPCVKMLQLM